MNTHLGCETGRNPTRRRKFVLSLVAAALAVVLSACGNNNDDDGAVLRAPVSAAEGGSFETADKAFRITIPAGALDSDGVLRVERVDGPPSVGEGRFSIGRPSGESPRRVWTRSAL